MFIYTDKQTFTQTPTVKIYRKKKGKESFLSLNFLLHKSHRRFSHISLIFWCIYYKYISILSICAFICGERKWFAFEEWPKKRFGNYCPSLCLCRGCHQRQPPCRTAHTAASRHKEFLVRFFLFGKMWVQGEVVARQLRQNETNLQQPSTSPIRFPFLNNVCMGFVFLLVHKKAMHWMVCEMGVLRVQTMRKRENKASERYMDHGRRTDHPLYSHFHFA